MKITRAVSAAFVPSSIAVTAAIIAIATPSVAGAVILDLSGVPNGALTAPVRIGDYVLTPRGLNSSTPFVGNYNGQRVIYAGTQSANGDDLFLTRFDGGLFTLSAVDVGMISSAQAGQGVGNVDTGFGVATNPTTTNRTVEFGTQFQNVRTIDLDSTFGGYFANINVTNAVPEPATWAMMMLGFGGMGFAMRRKTKVSTRVRFA